MQILESPEDQKTLLSQSGLPQNMLWRNMGIQKQNSSNWLKDMYKNSLLESFWIVLTSSVR